MKNINELLFIGLSRCREILTGAKTKLSLLDTPGNNNTIVVRSVVIQNKRHIEELDAVRAASTRP